jgi:hypothetical protein
VIEQKPEDSSQSTLKTWDGFYHVYIIIKISFYSSLHQRSNFQHHETWTISTILTEKLLREMTEAEELRFISNCTDTTREYKTVPFLL